MTEKGKSALVKHIYFFLFSFLTPLFICLYFCLGYLSHYCLCNCIVYVIRQFQLDSFDMYYLCLLQIQTFDLHITFFRFFFSAETFRHMPLHIYILLLSSIVVVSLLRTSIKWMSESFFFPWCIYFRNLPLTDIHTNRLKMKCVAVYFI